MLSQLVEHQDRALAIIDRGSALLTPTRGDGEALGRCRWELVRVLRAYQLFKHWRIFDPAIASGIPWKVQQANRMKDACVAMGDDLRAFVLHWNGADVASRWNDYRPAALAMAKQLRAHLATERREAAMLVQHDQTLARHPRRGAM